MCRSFETFNGERSTEVFTKILIMVDTFFNIHVYSVSGKAILSALNLVSYFILRLSHITFFVECRILGI